MLERLRQKKRQRGGKLCKEREKVQEEEEKRSGGLDVARRTSEELSELRRIQQLARTPSHLCQKEKKQSHLCKSQDREKGKNESGKKQHLVEKENGQSKRMEKKE